MINTLSIANSTNELRKKIQDALEIVKAYRQKLLDHDAPLWDPIVTKHTSKSPKRYRQRVSQVVAAEQLMKKGAEVHAEDKRHDRQPKRNK